MCIKEENFIWMYSMRFLHFFFFYYFCSLCNEHPWKYNYHPSNNITTAAASAVHDNRKIGKANERKEKKVK